MAEYIDKDKVLKAIDDEMSGYYTEEVSITDLFDGINKIPIADVVPKSEVEKANQEVEKADKEIERLTKILENYALQYGTDTDKQKVIEQAKQEVAREIFEQMKKRIHYEYTDLAYNVPEDDDYYLGKLAGISEAKNIIAEYEKKYIGE